MNRGNIACAHVSVTRRTALGGTAAALALGIGTACSREAPLSAPAAGQGPVKLRLLNAWGSVSTVAPLLEKVLTDFQGRYPRLTVEQEITNTAQGMGSPRVTKLITQIAGGTPPDVAMIWRGELPALALQGSLRALDDLLRQERFRPDIYYDAEYRTSQYQGKTYVLPNISAGAWQSLYYNRDMFAAAGIARDKPPETWDQLEDYARRLTTRDGSKLVRLGFDAAFVSAPGGPWVPLLYSNGGKLWADDARKVLFDGEAGVGTLQWLVDYYRRVTGGYPARQEWQKGLPPEAVSLGPFTIEVVAMMLHNPSQINHNLRTKPQMDFGVAPIPHSAKGRSQSPIRGGWSYGIPTGAPHVAESWQLVHWLTATKEGAGWFCMQQVRPSPMKAVNEDQYYLQAAPKVWPGVLKALAVDVAVPITPVDGDLDKLITEMTTAALEGRQGVKDAVSQAAAACQTKLNEFWARR